MRKKSNNIPCEASQVDTLLSTGTLQCRARDGFYQTFPEEGDPNLETNQQKLYNVRP